MEKNIIPVYLMPGMAAKPTIFSHIRLPEDQFEIFWLEWMMPEEDERLEHYAKRMIQKIKHDNPVLLGVSFGGILVQEMSKYMKVRKLIVVSSVKSRHELPKRMKVAKFIRVYKYIPTQLLSNLDVLKKYAFNQTVSKRIDLYKTYLAVNDKRYLDWAIKEMLLWDQDEPNSDAIYIHGDKDAIFTQSLDGECTIVKGGTHIMIVTRYKWFNRHLPELIIGSE